ncbi:MAG: glycosyltransferase, partial [Promethearchaeota archaeon]
RYKIIYLIGRDYVNWSIDKDRKHAQYFLRLNGVTFSENPLRITHVFCIWHEALLENQYSWIRHLKTIFNYKLIVFVTNDISYKDNRWIIDYLKNYVDYWVSPSKRIYQFLKNLKFAVFYIPFYVDGNEFYKLTNSKLEICRELKLDYNYLKDKVVIGSFQRDSTHDLLKPKMVKDPDLLIELLKKVDKKLFVLLIAGPRRHYIVNECIKEKIPFVYFGDLSYIQNHRDDLLANNHAPTIINKLYNLSDMYIITSKVEGGPKAILECALTKTLVFSTNVGLAGDFIHNDLIFSNTETKRVEYFISNFKHNKQKISEYIEFNHQNVSNLLNKKSYKNLYRNLLVSLYEQY